MSSPPRPHVSAALQHLRRSIYLAAAVVGLCLGGQVLVWAFVHYTDVRVVDLDEVGAHDKPRTNLTVVQSKPKQSAEEGTGEEAAPADDGVVDEAAMDPTVDLAAAKAAEEAERKKREAARAIPVETAAVNEVESEESLMLRRASQLVQSVGVLASLVLAVLMIEATVIAGGAKVPGVEKVVSATTWSLVICMLSVPARDVLTSMPWSGVFVNYDTLVEQSEAFRSGRSGAPRGFSFYAMNLILPGSLIVGLVVSTLWFRAGVEAGVIVTSVNQLDEKLEREIRSMKKGGLSAPRSVGALNAALGDDGGAEEDDDEGVAGTIGGDGGGGGGPMLRPRGGGGKPLSRPL